MLTPLHQRHVRFDADSRIGSHQYSISLVTIIYYLQKVSLMLGFPIKSAASRKTEESYNNNLELLRSICHQKKVVAAKCLGVSVYVGEIAVYDTLPPPTESFFPPISKKWFSSRELLGDSTCLSGVAWLRNRLRSR